MTLDTLPVWAVFVIAAGITFIATVIIVRIASRLLDCAALGLDRRRRRIDNRTINQYRVTPMFSAGKGDAK